jgi:alpha-tubulin suppressor-like RCC1 family protein
MSFGSINISNYGGMFLAKYNSAGTALWAINAGDNPGFQENGNFVIADASGNVYMAGNFQSLTITFGTITLSNTSNNQTNDMFLVKYDSSGNAHWAKLVAGVYDQEATSIACDALGNVYLTGYGLSPTIIFNQTTLSNPGMFLAKINTTTGINELVQNNTETFVYPNPANSILNIHHSIPSPNQQLIITDILGNEIYKDAIIGYDNYISVASWSNGIYFYEVREQEGSTRGKFVKKN